MSSQSRKKKIKDLKNNRMAKSADEKVQSSEEINKSFDDLLVVTKASILKKSKSDVSPSTRPTKFRATCSTSKNFNNLLLEEEETQTTNEVNSEKDYSLCFTARSSLSEKFKSCELLPDSPSSFTANLPSIKCDGSGDRTREYVAGIVQEAVFEEVGREESQLELCDAEELAEVIASVATSQACLETLEEDYYKRFEELEKERDTERAKNKKLLHKVSELEKVNNKLSDLVETVESSYSESYASLDESHSFKLEACRLEAKKNEMTLMKRMENLSGKLVVAESMLAGKEEIESALQDELERLEKVLYEKEEECKEELESMVSQHLKNELLIEAKSEVEEEVAGNLKNNRDEIDRAWLVADLRRAESELSLRNNSDEDTPKSSGPRKKTNNNIHCAFMTVHTPFSDKTNFDECVEALSPLSGLKKKRKLIESNKYPNEPSCEIDMKTAELVNYLNEVKDRLDFCEGENTVLKAENKSLLEELTLTQGKYQTISTEKKSLLEKLQNIENKLITSEEIIDEAVASRDTKDDTLLWKEAVERTERENDGLKIEIANLKEVIDGLCCKRTETLTEMATLEDKYFRLQIEVEQLKSRDGKLSSDGSTAYVQQYRHSISSLRSRDSTIYMDLMPHINSSDPDESDLEISIRKTHVGCQTDVEVKPEKYIKLGTNFELLCKTLDRLTADKMLYLRPSLVTELEKSWTERCEIEEQLACALAENAVLNRRVNQIDNVGRRLATVLSSGLQSITNWLQLHEGAQAILDDIEVLTSARKMEGEHCKEGARGDGMSLSSQESSLPIENQGELEVISHVHSGERMEPEGGHLPPDSEITHIPIRPSATDELTQTEAEFLDQSSNALIDVVQELLRYMGACEDELNVSLGERLRIAPDISSFLDASNCPDLRGELDRCFVQLKEEVAHIFAISRRSDLPSGVQHLQDEIKSLEQQLSASHKQVISLRAFVDEQAAEREQERDDFSRQLEELSEVLKQKERHLTNYEQLKNDVDNLEQQLYDATIALKKNEDERSSLNSKLEDAMSKIWAMRDIVSELEKQLANSCEELESVKQENLQLHDQLRELGQISLEMENANKDSQTDLLAYVAKLEEEVSSLRQLVELTNPESLAAVRTNLRELEVMIMRRTKDLELASVALNALSSASEELSNREIIDATRCPTPDEMQGDVPFGLEEDVDRLKERLLKHSRVEEAALKRMKELEHQARKVEELQVDLEVALHRLESYLAENAVLKAKLEEQRPKALQKELLTEMEQRLQQIEKELENAQDSCRNKEKLLIESGKREERLKEAIAAQEAIFRKEYSEQSAVKSKLESEKQRADAASSRLQELSYLPKVVNVLLAEKNEEIDLLKQQMAEASSNDSSEANSLESARSNKTFSSSSSSAKRVKFSVPESFVESITPIHLDNPSIVRDASSDSNQLNFIVPPVNEDFLWNNASSVSYSPISPPESSNAHILQLPPPKSSLLQSPYNSTLAKILPEITPSNTSSNNSSSQVSLDDLNLLLKSAQNEIINLNAELAKKTEACSKFEKTLCNLKQELEEANNKISNLTSTLTEKAALINQHDADVDNLRKQLNNAKNELEKLTANHEESVAQLKKELIELNSDVMKKNKEVRDVKHIARGAYKDLEKKLASSETLLKSSQKEVDDLKGKIKIITGELQLERNQKNLKSTDDDLKLNEVISQLTKQQEETLALKNSLQNAYKELEAVKSEREEMLAAMSGKTESLVTEVNAKKDKLELLQTLLLAKEQEILFLKKEHESALEQNSKLCTEKENTEELIKCKSNEILTLQRVILEKDENIIKLKEENDHQVAILTSRLEKDKELLDIEREKLTQVLHELESYGKVKLDIENVLKSNADEIKRLNDELLQEKTRSKDLEGYGKVKLDIENVLKSNADEIKRLNDELLQEKTRSKDLESALNEGKQIINRRAVELNEKECIISSIQSELSQERKKLYSCEQRLLQSHKMMVIGPSGDASSPSHQHLDDKKAIENSEQEVSDLKEHIKLLEKAVETLKYKLGEEQSRCDEDARIMGFLRVSLEDSLDKITSLQIELKDRQREYEEIVTELASTRRAVQQFKEGHESARVLQEAALRREEDLMNQLAAAQNQIQRLSALVESQVVQIRALTSLNKDDNNIPHKNCAANRAVRSAGDGAEVPHEMRLRVQRLESYRKALVWQKSYLLLRCRSTGGRSKKSKRRVSFRIAVITVVAMLRMKFVVRRWRSRLPPLPTSSSAYFGRERRMVLTSPPSKDSGVGHRLAF